MAGEPAHIDLLRHLPHKNGNMLGHTQAQTTARYAHLAITPVREAAGKVTSHLAELLALPKPENDDEFSPNGEPAPIMKTNMPDLPRYLTALEAAQVLNVDPRLLENWRWKRIGPNYIKLCGKIRYALPELEAFVTRSSQRVGTTFTGA